MIVQLYGMACYTRQLVFRLNWHLRTIMSLGV